MKRLFKSHAFLLKKYCLEKMKKKLKPLFCFFLVLILSGINILYGEEIKATLPVNTFSNQKGEIMKFFDSSLAESLINAQTLTGRYLEIFNQNTEPYQKNQIKNHIQNNNYYIPVSFFEDKENEKYSENPVRRFEIIFFISAPVALGFSFMGVLGYRAISGKAGPLSPAEYTYLALSTAGICISIALHDHRVMYSGKIK